MAENRYMVSYKLIIFKVTPRSGKNEDNNDGPRRNPIIKSWIMDMRDHPDPPSPPKLDLMSKLEEHSVQAINDAIDGLNRPGNVGEGYKWLIRSFHPHFDANDVMDQRDFSIIVILTVLPRAPF